MEARKRKQQHKRTTETIFDIPQCNAVNKIYTRQKDFTLRRLENELNRKKINKDENRSKDLLNNNRRKKNCKSRD